MLHVYVLKAMPAADSCVVNIANDRVKSCQIHNFTKKMSKFTTCRQSRGNNFATPIKHII